MSDTTPDDAFPTADDLPATEREVPSAVPTGAAATVPGAFGAPGRPLNRRSPFYVGLVGGSG